jgi:hypothetical protein
VSDPSERAVLANCRAGKALAALNEFGEFIWHKKKTKHCGNNAETNEAKE